ncbi:MAG TPA: heavy-metal-associated domain-containing protein [Chitinophaga sp.]|uniref:heavy-metal-associated domain-containing protein n=1 Tax=Chitinophaga sp. TaxID=1869181 RepID=UPI002DBD0CDA|nr:heavy-metal-associated domain-containing protein [Chitinophaga sp.]HEU4554460.1 heavy-metal-associated domain-containing protein [Chitinophaga sp.]
METLKFKTNIKCSGCVDTITPYLDKVAGKDTWTVDLQSPDKTLVVKTGNAITSADVINALEKAGYKASNV